MAYQLPPDLEQMIRDQMRGGGYASEEELLRDAFAALRARNDDLAAIEQGLEDMQAGRLRPFEEAAEAIRRAHGLEP
jgi:Arc/MetJ-type ribon-helix-helix transcriptional regulator